MSENAIKRIADKVINDEFPDIALTAEQKELIETFIGDFGEAIEKLAEYITNNFVPTIEDAVKLVANFANKSRNPTALSGQKEEYTYMQQKQLLTEKDIKSVETILAKGNRVELIPVKNGVKVIKIERENVKNE